MLAGPLPPTKGLVSCQGCARGSEVAHYDRRMRSLWHVAPPQAWQMWPLGASHSAPEMWCGRRRALTDLSCPFWALSHIDDGQSCAVVPFPGLWREVAPYLQCPHCPPCSLSLRRGKSQVQPILNAPKAASAPHQLNPARAALQPPSQGLQKTSPPAPWR